jgi:HlyD family secretion protein
VGKGQILAILDPTLFEASVTEADGNLKKAETELALARAKDTRNKPLYAKGHISEEEYLPIRSAVKTAEAAVTATEAALKRARANLNYATIRSPINGTVIERSVEAGQTIAASLNTPTLFVIAEDLSRMQIKTNVDESDIGRVHENIPVRFTVQTHQGQTFTGRVTRIRLQPKTISNVVNYTVVVDAENGEGLLLPGMTATVDLVVGKAENVLLVANSALRFTPEQREGSDQAHTGKKTELSSGSHNSPASSSLYILGNDGKPSRIMVHTGLSNDQMTEVDDAGELREDMVVIAGQKADNNPKKPKISLLPAPPGR